MRHKSVNLSLLAWIRKILFHPETIMLSGGVELTEFPECANVTRENIHEVFPHFFFIPRLLEDVKNRETYF